MAKRGRPKLNRPLTDLGTPEAIRKRQDAIGPQRPGWPPPDLAHSTSAIGVLLWGGHLGKSYDAARRLYEAGVTFAGLWLLKYPRCQPVGTLGRLQPGGARGVDRDDAERALSDASAAIGKASPALGAVIDACVYQRVDARRLRALRLGLRRLVMWQRERRAVV